MNRKGIPSIYIRRRQVTLIIDAANFAEHILDRRLTHFLTLTFLREHVCPQEFMNTFIKLSGDWLGTHGVPRVYIGVIERPPCGPLNIHLLMQIPDDLVLRFSQLERGWMREAGLTWRKKAYQRTKIGLRKGERNRQVTYGEYGEALVRTISYILKGAEPEVCKLLGIDHKPQGVIYGKRVFVSESINAKARKAHGYLAPASLRYRDYILLERARLSEAGVAQPLYMPSPVRKDANYTPYDLCLPRVRRLEAQASRLNTALQRL